MTVITQADITLIENYCHLICRKAKITDTDTQQDIIGDALLAAAKAETTHDPELSAARTWVIHNAKWAALNAVRDIKADKLPTVSLDDAIFDEVDLDDSEPASLYDILPDEEALPSDEIIEGEEGRKALYRAIEQLSRDEQLVIIKMYGLGGDPSPRTQRETAEALGMSRRNMMRLHYTATNKLREILRDE